MAPSKPSEPPKAEREAEIARLLVRERSFMLRVARELCGTLGEDAVQEASLRALLRPPRHLDSPRGWLRRVVTNVSLEILRAERRLARRQREAARHEGLAPKDDESQRLKNAIARALQAMPEAQGRTLRLRLVDGLSPAEIARRTEASLEAVRSQLRRGREGLRRSLDREYGGRKEWAVVLALAASLKPASRSVLLTRPLVATLFATAASLVFVVLGSESRTNASFPQPSRERSSSDTSALATSSVRSRAVLPTSQQDQGIQRLILGRCVDPTGRPISGAEVFLFPKADSITIPMRRSSLSSTFSRVDGSFDLTTEHDSVYLVATSPSGGLSAEVAEVTLEELGDQAVVLELHPGRPVRGQIFDRDPQPVPSADVRLFSRTAFPRTAVRTPGPGIVMRSDVPLVTSCDASGAFSFPMREGERRQLHAAAEGHPPALHPATAGSWIRLSLIADRELSIRATFQGKPVPGVQTELYGLGEEEPWRTTTGRDGRANFSALPGSPYWVARLSAPGFTTSVTLPRGMLPETVPLRRARPRVVQLRDENDLPVSQARLSFLARDAYEATVSAGFSPEKARQICGYPQAISDEEGRVPIPAYAGDLLVRIERSDPDRTQHVVIDRSRSEDTVHLQGNATGERRVLVEPEGEPMQSLRMRQHEFVDFDLVTSPWRPLPTTGAPVPVLPSSGGTLRAIEIAAEGHRTAYIDLLRAPAENPVLVSLAPSRSGWIRATSATGQPLQNAELIATDTSGRPLDFAQGPGLWTSRLRLDADGRTFVKDLPTTPWCARLVTSGFQQPLITTIADRQGLDANGSEDTHIVFPARLDGRRRPVDLHIAWHEKDEWPLHIRVEDAAGTPFFDEMLVRHKDQVRKMRVPRQPSTQRNTGEAPRPLNLQPWGGSPASSSYRLEGETLLCTLQLPEEEVIVLVTAGSQSARILFREEDLPPLQLQLRPPEHNEAPQGALSPPLPAPR